MIDEKNDPELLSTGSRGNKINFLELDKEEKRVLRAIKRDYDFRCNGSVLSSLLNKGLIVTKHGGFELTLYGHAV